MMTHLPYVATVSLLSALVVTGLLGCKPVYEGPQRVAMSGQVLYDGKPLQEGVLNLVPEAPSGRAISTPIVGGEYFIRGINGPVFGTYRVEIVGFPSAIGKVTKPTESSENEAENGTGKEDAKEAKKGENDGIDREQESMSSDRQIIPAKYNSESQLVLEINSPVVHQDWKLSP